MPEGAGNPPRGQTGRRLTELVGIVPGTKGSVWAAVQALAVSGRAIAPDCAPAATRGEGAGRLVHGIALPVDGGWLAR